MPEIFENEKEPTNITPEEREEIEEQLQAEKEERIYKALRGCNMVLIGVTTVVIIIILLVVNFFL